MRFFQLPVDDRSAMPVLRQAVAAKGLDDLTRITPVASYGERRQQPAVEPLVVGAALLVGVPGETVQAVTAIPTMGLLRGLPAMEPKEPASPKGNTAPLAATSQ